MYNASVAVPGLGCKLKKKKNNKTNIESKYGLYSKCCFILHIN